MMPFHAFTDEVYEGWFRKNKDLSGFSNTTQLGIAGEKYVAKLLKKEGYHVILSKHSRTPADIYAIKFRGYFWHIWLLQVKTRESVKLEVHHSRTSPKEDHLLSELGEFLNKQIDKSTLMKLYASKPILISMNNVYVDFVDSKFYFSGFWYNAYIKRNMSNRKKHLAIALIEKAKNKLYSSYRIKI